MSWPSSARVRSCAAAARTRWTAAVAAAWIQCVGGSSYCFGVYSPLLKSSQGYDQATLDAVALAKNIGANAGILSGLLSSWTPFCFARRRRRLPWLVLFAGAIQCFAGYFPMYLAVSGKIPPPPWWAMFAFMFLAAHAQTFFNTADVVVSVENFPNCRGTVIGIMKGFLGLSGAILVQMYHIYNNASSFILMLAILPSALSILLMFFVEVHHRGDDDEHDKKFLDTFSVIALSVAGYLTLVIVADRIFLISSLWQAVIFAMLLLMLVSPLPVAIAAQTSASNPPPEDDGSISLLNAAAEHDLSWSREFNLVSALSSPDFWLLFFPMACGMGSGLATVDNISQIGAAAGYATAETGTLVSLWSIWNFLGRFGAGYISDYFLRTQALPRPFFVSAALVAMGVGHLVIASGLPWSLHAGSVLVGFCYGSQWALMPSITSEIFGLRHFGTIFNTVAFASPAGAYILSVRIVAFIYDRESPEGGGPCIGLQCFAPSFLAMACVCFMGSAVALILYYRTREFYRQAPPQRRAKLFS